MLTRREFAGGAAAGMAALALGPRAFGKKADRPLGVQLYTVRSIIGDDLHGTLAAIQKIGYKTVEAFAAQYSKITAKDLRQAISDAGLTVPSGHFGYPDFDSKFDYAKELGVECMVCASIPASIANSGDGYKRAADQYNKWGEKAKSMGMKFGFHDHDTEFKVFDGVTGFDILMDHTDPKLVGWQMDCYWVAQAGYDPVAMLHKHGKRMQSLHLKDRKPNSPISTETGPGSQFFTEVGEGTLDWPTILRLSDQNHIPNMYVEQDITERPPLECLKISYDHLVKYLSA